MKSLLLCKVDAVLNFIAASDHPVSLKELNLALNFSPATLSRITADLCEMGMIEKAGYHSFVPGVDLFLLADAAMGNAPVSKAADKVLSSFAAQNNLNVLLLAGRRKRIFRIFSRIVPPQSRNILWGTGAGVMLLASLNLSPNEEMALFSAENPDADDAEKVIFAQNLLAARRDGMLFRVRQLRQWALSLPFTFRGTPYVLTVFGSVPERFDNQLFEQECRRLISRLLSTAKDFFQDGK